MILQVLCVLLLIPAVLACLYQVGLAVVAMIPHRRTPFSPLVAQHHFAIVIPAHNEETAIPDVLRSCADLDYPTEKIKIYIIADNCDDRTAAVARLHGARCLERRDSTRRGKGHALAWALPQVLADGPDAVIILDADCRLTTNALTVFDCGLRAGDRVLQANYVPDNTDESLVSYVTGVANLMENDLFYAPKSRLGLAVLLRGTGMVFHRDVLERCPWQAGSIVEDAEYSVRLSEAGIPVRFVEEALVVTAFPNRSDQLTIQRERWIGGTVVLGRSRSLGLLFRGLLAGRLHLFDLGWTLFVCLRSLLLVELLAASLLSLAALIGVPGPSSDYLALTVVGMIAAYGSLFTAAALKLGLTRQRLRFLSQAPSVVLRFLLISSRAVVMGPPRRWNRTPR